MQLIVHLLISSVILLVISKFLPGFEIKDFKTSVIVALVFGILMALSGLLVAPLSFLTNGIASLLSIIPLLGSIAGLAAKIVLFLINFIVGSIMLCVTDMFIKGFKMRSFGVGIVAAFLIALINALIPTF
jgi:putative membrane protein